MVTRELTLGPTTLSITEAGDGTPVVFLHAFPLNARMWTPQLAALPAGWRGVAPDLRGFGKSPRGATPARHVRDHADDVIALVRGARCGPRWCWSGCRWAVTSRSSAGVVDRRRFAALVFADTRAEADTDEARARRVAHAGRRGARRDRRRHRRDAARTARCHDRTRPTRTSRSRCAHWALETEADGVIDALEALRTRPDSRATLADDHCPTLVIVGEEDTLTPPALSRVIADGIDGATLVRVPRAGHLRTSNSPTAFSSALTTGCTASPDRRARLPTPDPDSRFPIPDSRSPIRSHFLTSDTVTRAMFHRVFRPAALVLAGGILLWPQAWQPVRPAVRDAHRRRHARGARRRPRHLRA